MQKTALALRHLAFEDLGSLEPVLISAGYAVRYHDIGLDDFTKAAEADPGILIVLGGPVGVYETDRYPWLLDEVDLLAKRLAARRPTLGICLGAQLITRALGAAVYPGTVKEIGIAPVTLTTPGQRVLAEIGGHPVLHWHGDTFDLPTGSELLASTPAYINQAFAVGGHALGLQFHAEVAPAAVERWLIGHAHELAHGLIHPARLRAQAAALEPLGPAIAACMGRWLSRL